MKKFKIILNLFLTFFKIGAFTFGGGLAMIALFENEFVTKKKFIEQEELLNIIAVAQSTPGPIAINCATFIGYKKGGFIGSLFSTLGVILPSFIIIYIISIYISWDIPVIANAFKGIKAAVGILILLAGIKMIKKMEKRTVNIILLISVCLLSVMVDLFNIDFSSIYFIVIGGLIGYIIYKIDIFRQKKENK